MTDISRIFLLLGLLVFGSSCRHAPLDSSPAADSERPMSPREKAAAEAALRSSVVVVRLSQQLPDWRQPWKKQAPTNHTAQGLVLSDRKILLHGWRLGNHTFVEVQKLGKDEWYAARVFHYDRDVSIALLEVDEPQFWSDLSALRPFPASSLSGEVQVARWEQNRMEVSAHSLGKSDVTQVGSGPIYALKISATADLGNGSVVLKNGLWVGMLGSRSGQTHWVTPASLLDRCVRMAQIRPYRGFGWGGFFT